MELHTSRVILWIASPFVYVSNGTSPKTRSQNAAGQDRDHSVYWGLFVPTVAVLWARAKSDAYLVILKASSRFSGPSLTRAMTSHNSGKNGSVRRYLVGVVTKSLQNTRSIPSRSGTVSWEDRPNSTLQRGDCSQRSRLSQRGRLVLSAGQ
jgi:hypothetical protein